MDKLQGLSKQQKWALTKPWSTTFFLKQATTTEARPGDTQLLIHADARVQQRNDNIADAETKY